MKPPKLGPYWAQRQPQPDAGLGDCRRGLTQHFDNAAMLRDEAHFKDRWRTFAPEIVHRFVDLLEDSPRGNPIRHPLLVGSKPYMASISSIEFAAMATRLVPVIEEHGVLTVLEIGGGYGGLASAILKAAPGLHSWTIYDIPSVGRISRWYLAEEPRVSVITDDYKPIAADLVVQTRGFMEMSPDELAFWFDLMQTGAILKLSGLLWTINRVRPKVVGFADYPFDTKWEVLHKAPWPESDMIEVLLKRRAEKGPSVPDQLGLERSQA